MAGTSQLAGSRETILLATVLDGIPESFVLGRPWHRTAPCRSLSSSACFASNVPEAFVGDDWPPGGRMDASARLPDVVGRGRCVGGGLGAGFELLDAMGSEGGAFALAFAGGAVLVMLADTLMPEAFELGGREAGLLTVLGFAVAFALS